MRRQPTGGAYDPLSIPARRGDLWEEATLPRTQGPRYSLCRPFLRQVRRSSEESRSHEES